MIRSLALAIACALTVASPVASPVAAQATFPDSAYFARDSAIWATLVGFTEGERMRVAMLRSRWVGRFQRIAGDTLYFGSPGQPPMALRFNAVDTLWRASTARGRGAWIGAASLAVVGGVGGALVVGSGGSDGSSYDVGGKELGGALIGTALGAGLGAIVGSAIGSGFRTWRRVYP
jgi:hypothetical protein